MDIWVFSALGLRVIWGTLTGFAVSEAKGGNRNTGAPFGGYIEGLSMLMSCDNMRACRISCNPRDPNSPMQVIP